MFFQLQIWENRKWRV